MEHWKGRCASGLQLVFRELMGSTAVDGRAHGTCWALWFMVGVFPDQKQRHKWHEKAVCLSFFYIVSCP